MLAEEKRPCRDNYDVLKQEIGKNLLVSSNIPTKIFKSQYLFIKKGVVLQSKVLGIWAQTQNNKNHEYFRQDIRFEAQVKEPRWIEETEK